MYRVFRGALLIVYANIRNLARINRSASKFQTSVIFFRHCEERSDAAVSNLKLLRNACNDQELSWFAMKKLDFLALIRYYIPLRIALDEIAKDIIEIKQIGVTWLHLRRTA